MPLFKVRFRRTEVHTYDSYIDCRDEEQARKWYKTGRIEEVDRTQGAGASLRPTIVGVAVVDSDDVIDDDATEIG
jgi:hypothetical protein